MPPAPAIAAVFFDLGDTLGTATISGQPPRLARFDLFPFVLPSGDQPGVLDPLRNRGLRLGVISNTGSDGASAINAVLQPTGLLDHLDLRLLIYSADEGVTKASPEIFHKAAARAGLPDAQCLFVGESPNERDVAASVGWKVCPHPLLVQETLDGESLRFVRGDLATDLVAAEKKPPNE